MDVGEPSSYEEAITKLDADTWPEVMRSEMDSIHENRTWVEQGKSVKTDKAKGQ